MISAPTASRHVFCAFFCLRDSPAGCRKFFFDTLRMKVESGFPFHSIHQFLEKWPIQREETLNRLIFRPGIDRGNNILLLLGPAKPVLRIADERAKALSYFPGVCRRTAQPFLFSAGIYEKNRPFQIVSDEERAIFCFAVSLTGSQAPFFLPASATTFKRKFA